ncbi:MAG: tail fiber protein [Pseudomonadota bacterium]
MALTGELRIFPYHFVPRGYAEYDGATLSIDSNVALFSIIDTMFGGDGIDTIALPDLRGRVPLGLGQTTGASAYAMGETGGSETVALTTDQLPAHSHTVRTANLPGTEPSPSGHLLSVGGQTLTSKNPPDTPMADGTVSAEGLGQEHDNMMPWIAMDYFIAIHGRYPPR